MIEESQSGCRSRKEMRWRLKKTDYIIEEYRCVLLMLSIGPWMLYSISFGPIVTCNLPFSDQDNILCFFSPPPIW